MLQSLDVMTLSDFNCKSGDLRIDLRIQSEGLADDTKLQTEAVFLVRNLEEERKLRVRDFKHVIKCLGIN